MGENHDVCVSTDYRDKLLDILQELRADTAISNDRLREIIEELASALLKQHEDELKAKGVMW